ncbi:MAG: KUP/HAK/KT family potassium transporter, partial [Burkholderiales bacterium]
IYIGRINWAMYAGVVGLVLAFRSSTNLAAAYGIAVSGSMVLETLLVITVIVGLKGAARPFFLWSVAVVGVLEALFLASNATKILEGGWFPLLCAVLIFTLLTTWKRGTDILTAAASSHRVPLAGFFERVSAEVPRVPGTAVFMSAAPDSVPTTLLHNLKHNKVLHERTICLAFSTEDVPTIDDEARASVNVIEPRRLYQITMRYGFREDPDVPRALKLLERNGLKFDLNETTFFLGKSTIAPARRAGAFTWRRILFRWMQRNSSGAAEYFRLPPDRVIELGTQLKI